MSQETTVNGTAPVVSDANFGGQGEGVAGTVYCTTCGHKMAMTAQACPQCGAPNSTLAAATSDKTMVAAALLCFFLGSFGFHRFYVGKVGTGILMLLTLGLLGIWTLIDFVMIIVGAFKDKEGRPLKR